MQLAQAWEDEKRKLEEIKEEENDENNYNKMKEDEKDVIIKRKGCLYKDEKKISDTLKKTHPLKEEKYDNNKEGEIKKEDNVGKEDEEENDGIDEIILEDNETVTDLNNETINKILTKVLIIKFYIYI